MIYVLHTKILHHKHDKMVPASKEQASTHVQNV